MCVGVKEGCWFEPVLGVVLISMEIYQHASLLTLFLWLHISITFLVVVSRNVGYDTLFVTRDQKFRLLYFDRDLNACLSVSDEWFVFKVWQRKMISCCSTISLSIAYISGTCLLLEKLCPMKTVGFNKNKDEDSV